MMGFEVGLAERKGDPLARIDHYTPHCAHTDSIPSALVAAAV
jgi:hypothetical protein